MGQQPGRRAFETSASTAFCKGNSGSEPANTVRAYQLPNFDNHKSGAGAAMLGPVTFIIQQ